MVILTYWWQLLLIGVAVYLACNINYAVIFSKKIKHQDIRQCGSGNPGTANVVRTFGLKMGVATFCCDLTKGILAAVIGRYILPLLIGTYDIAVFSAFFFALCATLGHMYPVTLKFKGGKGVATSLGALLILNPGFTGICLIFAIVIILLTDKVSIFALLNITAQFIYTAIISLTNAEMLALGTAVPTTIIIGVIWAVIFYAHRANIKRILTGKENNSGIKAGLFKKYRQNQPKPDATAVKADQPLSDDTTIATKSDNNKQ